MHSKHSKQHIVFTGGGSAGHVTPNLALIEEFREHGWHLSYIGSTTGIERKLVSAANVAYFPISSGKLRRYFSWRNFTDPFKVLFGAIQAFFILRRLRPSLIFAKGGFVSFPVVLAGFLQHIPVIVHESDLTPGLANKLSFPFANKICLTFAATAKHFSAAKQSKLIVTGNPIRKSFLEGDAGKGLAFCNFTPSKPVIVVFGGSLGADSINRAIRQSLPWLIKHNFQIVHICGSGNIKKNINYSEYKQFEYLNREFPHILAAASIVICRSGANSVYEVLALRKPHIFIPLPKSSSRGDQIDNALHFAKQGLSRVIMEKDLNSATLETEIQNLQANRSTIIAKLKALQLPNSTELIYSLAQELYTNRK